VGWKRGGGSGYFAFNATLGFWTLEPVPESTVDIGWKSFAEVNGIDPETWPLV
jgi:hypothetical protein